MDSNTKTVFTVLKYTYGLVPIVAGLDKFINILTDWSQYMSSGLIDLLPFKPSIFMAIVGVIEIIAGIMVLIRPKIGGYVVMGWLLAIALTLLFSGKFIDVAVRDIVMAIGAFSLATLATNEMVTKNN
ncbi:hypothetical protein [Aquimarina sp. 2201CG5-10]|uniref:hypothetical protein n=1 Tax=Aquimarina callyspongiae TaxID=3098150 RepID=UPI002AB4A7AB|nr:hypothetical protein [Aquimarina sp. 2201CG5-10]MDY8138536.1 hypothetical protein [Aquimarina sp. 2201CG5-10]